MCMSFALLHPATGPLMASDRRLTTRVLIQRHSTKAGVFAEDEATVMSDTASRVIRLPRGGWAMGIGIAPLGIQVLKRAIEMDVSNHIEFAQAVRLTHESLPLLKFRYPDADLEGGPDSAVVTAYVYVDNEALANVAWNGQINDVGNPQVHLSLPKPDDEEAEPGAFGLLRWSELRAFLDPSVPRTPAPSAEDIIRRIAREFADWADVATTTSPSIQLGWSDGFLICNARELSTMEDNAIRALLQDPPPPMSQVQQLQAAYDRHAAGVNLSPSVSPS